MARHYIILGAAGTIGTQIQGYLLTNTSVGDTYELIGREDIIHPTPAGTDTIVINATTAFGADFQSLLDRLSPLGGDFMFWHISTQAAGNGTEYGHVKLADEHYLSQTSLPHKIFRLGVPVVAVAGCVVGLGYWHTVCLKGRGLVLKLNGVVLHSVDDLMQFFEQDQNQHHNALYIPIPFGKILRRVIPFRLLNKVLSGLNMAVLG